MSEIPTVQIEHPDGYAVINEADFDPAVHRRFGAPRVCGSDGGTDRGPGMANPQVEPKPSRRRGRPAAKE